MMKKNLVLILLITAASPTWASVSEDEFAQLKQQMLSLMKLTHLTQLNTGKQQQSTGQAGTSGYNSDSDQI